MPIPRIASALAALAVTTAASPVRADADADGADAPPAEPRPEIPSRRDEVSLGLAARALRSPSANALTGANLAGGTVGIARDLGRDLGASLIPRLTLWAEAGLVTGSAEGMMFQSLSTSIDALAVTGGIAARYRLHRRLSAAARAALGAQRARADIK